MRHEPLVSGAMVHVTADDAPTLREVTRHDFDSTPTYLIALQRYPGPERLTLYVPRHLLDALAAGEIRAVCGVSVALQTMDADALGDALRLLDAPLLIQHVIPA